MVKLLKRGKRDESESAPAPMPDAEAAAGQAPPTTEMQEPEAPTTATEPPAADAPVQAAADYEPAAPYEPSPPPPSANVGGRQPGGLLSRVYGDVGEQSAEERDRIAAMEFEQAISPVLDLMRASVPEASTPEEAARILAANQGEVTPDPQGGAYVPGDAYDADARVYYRLLRRDYEKNPRPSQKRGVSHHLHGVYGKLTGTKGW